MFYQKNYNTQHIVIGANRVIYFTRQQLLYLKNCLLLKNNRGKKGGK